MNCPKCNSELVRLRSTFRKECSNGKCDFWEEWPLEKGEKSLLGSNRQDRRPAPQ